MGRYLDRGSKVKAALPAMRLIHCRQDPAARGRWVPLVDWGGRYMPPNNSHNDGLVRRYEVDSRYQYLRGTYTEGDIPVRVGGFELTE